MKRNSFLLAAGMGLATLLSSQAQPTFIDEPQSQSVSLGVDIILYGLAYGAGPVTYQWRKNGADLPGETMELLVLSPLRPTDSGDYDLVATDFTGSVTSQVATIIVDPTFTKITSGPVVNGFGVARGGAWADYDGDGFLDLFVAHDANLNNALYHNNGDGTFTQISKGPVVSDGGYSYGGAWGDLNNDGFPDLFVPNYSAQNDFLYVNNGNGAFTKITNGPAVSDGRNTFGAAWADIDNDGRVDLFAVNVPYFSYPPPIFIPGGTVLYRNNGDGTFTSLSNAPGTEVTGGGFFGASITSPSWADYDNDGRMDLFMSRADSQPPLLYRNLGSNLFARVLSGPFTNDSASSAGGVWGDYDNDGWTDLFVTKGLSGTAETNSLYHNNADGTFSLVTNGLLAEHVGFSIGAAWGDYDNDGFLDLFVTDTTANNSLYHNSGDGTFTRVTEGSLVNDTGLSLGCAWADYDNDGFLDLFVANDDQGNFLYRNSGNSNAWLKVTCVGRFSNRAAVGTKLLAAAVIGGTHRWQLREITGGNTFGSQPLVAHFGLGDASKLAILRVQWPSGITQELRNLPVNQSLVLPEPAYTVMPTNPGAALGTDFVFYVGGTNGAPLQFQWRFNGADIPDATNDTLVVTNVQTDDLGTYSVQVSDPSGAFWSVTLPEALRVAAPPAFVAQPQPAYQSVSLGVNLTYQSTVTGLNPLVLQWRLNGVDIPGATNATLSFTNIQVSNAGTYTLVATNLGGASTSQVLVLNVDPTFTKIITGNVVNDAGAAYGTAWFPLGSNVSPALFVTHVGSQSNFLYWNNGDGSFTRLLSTNIGSIVSDRGDSTGVALGDYDNDGVLDLFVANYVNQNDFLYHGEPDGTFTRITNGPVVSDSASTWSGAWADYDRDGFLDLFVTSFANDLLYRNNGDGTFTRITNTVLATSGGISRGCAWADYDNDGDPDLFVVNASQVNFLFRNNGDGTFLRVTNGSIATDTSGSYGCSWGDYDNDGDLDLFVARNGNDWLYQNNGDGSFTKITNSIVATSGSNSWACAWVDYDNDGWLDLFAANNGSDFLYRNNGDGTFTRITTGSPANDGGDSRTCAWGDYDNDGFPDLFIANYSQGNFLYRNNGNANHWLKVKCIGTTSNRSAIGAKVRVQATINGTPRWQLREITSGDGLGGHGLIPIFGLGDATGATTVRVEWPSGRVDEVHDVPANQLLVLTEPLARPRLSAPRMIAGEFHFQLIGNAGQVYAVETSTNLQEWVPWLTVTNDIGTVSLSHPEATNFLQLYYRAVAK